MAPLPPIIPFVHSFDLLVPKELFKDHPEYFPLIDGQRKDGYVQRCLTIRTCSAISAFGHRAAMDQRPSRGHDHQRFPE